MCPLAAEAAPSRCADAPRLLGAGRRVNGDVRACPRGQPGAVALGGPQNTEGGPAAGTPSRPVCLRRLWGKTAGPRLSPHQGPSRSHARARAGPRRGDPVISPWSRLHPARGSDRAGLSGGTRMGQLPPQRRLLLAPPPVECRTGLDGRGAVCWRGLGDHPLAGAGEVCRHRAGTALTRVLADGQGSWRMLTRLAQGRLGWGPTSADARGP